MTMNGRLMVVLAFGQCEEDGRYLICNQHRIVLQRVLSYLPIHYKPVIPESDAHMFLSQHLCKNQVHHEEGKKWVQQ